jgi:thiamine biosynthesis lipoprotein ApbE
MTEVNESELLPRPQGAGRTLTRREFSVLGIGAFVVAALPVVGRRPLHLVRRRAPSMGTVAELVVVHRDPVHAQGAIDAALRELGRVEASLTRFRADSEVGRVNLAAGKDPAFVSEETARVVLEALRWAEVSDGAFDPSIGRAVALWNVGESVQPPDGDKVQALAARGLYRGVVVDRWRGRSSHPGWRTGTPPSTWGGSPRDTRSIER